MKDLVLTTLCSRLFRGASGEGRSDSALHLADNMAAGIEKSHAAQLIDCLSDSLTVHLSRS